MRPEFFDHYELGIQQLTLKYQRVERRSDVITIYFFTNDVGQEFVMWDSRIREYKKMEPVFESGRWLRVQAHVRSVSEDNTRVRITNLIIEA